MEEGALCPECWKNIRFVTEPFCFCCGVPFEFDIGAGGLCPSCQERRPCFGQARSAFIYDEFSRNMALRFKHADQTQYAPVFARWMARSGADLLAKADLLIPAPLHPLRLLKRRYNQAALLAHALTSETGTPTLADGLARIRNTPNQGGGGGEWRRLNVMGAFAVKNPQNISGKRILLIDDVRTTGATANECARVLLAAGAKGVDLLTLAQAVL